MQYQNCRHSSKATSTMFTTHLTK